MTLARSCSRLFCAKGGVRSNGQPVRSGPDQGPRQFERPTKDPPRENPSPARGDDQARVGEVGDQRHSFGGRGVGALDHLYGGYAPASSRGGGGTAPNRSSCEKAGHGRAAGGE